MPRRLGFLLVASLAAGAVTSKADTLPQPVWELGAGLGALAFPPWIGSRQHDAYVLPVPYFVYRGERIQADRNGIRGLLFDSGSLALRLSLAASPPPNDRGDALRDGMPGLDPVFELGPELRWLAWESRDMHTALYLRLPLRAAIAASGDGLDSVGWFASPALNLEIHEWPAPGWKIGINTGPVFGDADYHAYYYDVAPRYANAGRPAYEADAGYGGLQLTGSLTRRRGNWWVGAFVRAQYIRGAAFEDSPLVRTDTSVAGGIAFAWVFERSERTIRLRDGD